MEKDHPKTLIVTIPGMIGEVDLAPLRERSDVDYCELQSITEAELAERCAGYDYLMLNMDVVPKTGSLKLTETFYAHPAVRNLKTIAVDMTGMDYFSPKAAAASGVILQNIPHYSSQSVAESILAEILLHSRQRHLAYVDEIKRQPIEARKGINLTNRAAGIVGYGSIGSTVAGLVESLGMKVLVWNRSPKAGVNSVSLEYLFEQSSVICVCLKTVHEGQEANVGLIGAELLGSCHGAIIVNLANEALVDAKAMADALSSGKVAAYSVEASPSLNTALGSHPSVHFAPSNAWNSDESMQMLRNVWVANVLSVIVGKPQNVYRE
jgi:phosphoglycerate dehydrogenase-like enzyme